MPTPTKVVTCALATLCAVLLAAISLPQRAAAADNDDPPGRVARLSYLRGSVSFQPAGESEWVTAAINRPVTTGDKLWADADSQAELHIGSAVIRLSSNTGFSFLSLDDRTVQIQLSAGTLGIRVRRLERDEIFEVDTPNQAFSILRPGRYRVEATEDGDRTIVMVRDGKGEATAGDRTYTIESHERASLTGTDTLSADIDKMNARDRDDFDDWCEERDRREDRSRSVRYVSPEMVGYEDLDDSGVWRRDPEYGEVWVPTAVPVGWAPYHYGHWAWISPWGWTWVDDAPWGYAPFHYGRWAYAGGAWCWVPGPVAERPVYAPALVAFVGGPNFAVGVAVGGGVAVGWFPLGPREVYVPAYRTTPDYVTRVNVTNTNINRTTVTNVYNTTVVNNTSVVNNVTYVNRTAPGAVTAVPSNAFTSSQSVAAAAVEVNQTQIASAPVVTRAQVVPTQSSVLGSPEREPRRAVPPRFVDRPVVAKTTPPPPPVSFERQQSALAAHPGQPLARNEVETLRPANVEHPLVKPTGRSQPETPNRGEGQVARTPETPNRRPDNPANVRGNENGNRPGNNPAANMPARNDRPESERPGNRPSVSEAPNAQPGYRPNNGQPSNVPPNNRAEQQNRPEQPVNTPGPVPSNNRPANSQPGYRPPSSSPSSAPPQSERPNLGRPESQRPAIDNRQPNAPAPVPSNNRPANVQPSYRQPSQQSQPSQPSHGDRPNAGSSPAERPAVNNQPQTAPSVQPNNRPSNAPVSRPTPTPAPENRAAEPRPQPSGNARAVPENQQHAASPAPAGSNNNSSNNKRENEKKN